MGRKSDQYGLVEFTINHNNNKKKGQNRIATTKYRWWNFLFLFLYEQYQRVFNIFSLVVMICNLMPFAGVVTNSTLITPIVFVLAVAAIREIIEDLSRLRSDKYNNRINYHVIRDGELVADLQSQNIRQGDIIILEQGQEVPVDAILLFSSNSDTKQALLNTASLDGENNLKSKNQLLQNVPQLHCTRNTIYTMLKGIRGNVETERPNTNMSQFTGVCALTLCVDEQYVLDRMQAAGGESETVDNYTQNDKHSTLQLQFSIENALLRGMVLECTEYVAAIAVFTGMNTKMMKTQTKTRIKRSRLEVRLNKIQLVLIGLLLGIVFINMLLSRYYIDQHAMRQQIYYELEPQSGWRFFITRFLQLIVILSYFLPISLMVTLELTRFFQAMFVDADQFMRIDAVRQYLAVPGRRLHGSQFNKMAPCQLSVQVRNSPAVENLAELDVLFSDKTGTITRNEMRFHSFVDHTNAIHHADGRTGLAGLELFCAGLCHTVECRVVDAASEFQATSPDEVALVTRACLDGLKLRHTTATTVAYDYMDAQLQYEVLAVIPFTSVRKRMSIVLREITQDGRYFTPQEICSEPGRPFVLVKGADSVMMEILYKSRQAVPQDALQKSIDALSEQGLRTLVFGCRSLSDAFAKGWLHEWESCKTLPEADGALVPVAEAIESQLTYAAVSAVEDLLQDDVQGTITALKQAGISVWMLTGDKTLTAMSIARSAGLSHKGNRWLLLTEQELQGRRSQLGERRALESMIQNAIDAQLGMLESQHNVRHYTGRLASYEANFKRKSSTRSPRSKIYPLGYKNLAVPTTVVLDAHFFRLCLQHQLQAKLFHICFSSSVVIACRLFPNEKALIVRHCHLYCPDITTASVGDGANDIEMIKQAQIGIGVAGKEGFYACSCADISIPEFKFLKRLILMHGRLNHYRNSELIEYAFYKNSMLVFCNLIYQYYCLFTSQIIVESFLLMMFNTLITTISIFLFTLSEKDIYDADAMKDPLIFRNFSKKFDFNILSLLKTILYSLYSAIVIFYMSMLWFSDGVTTSSGVQGDLYYFQSFLTFNVLVTAITKVFITSRVWNAITAIGLALSVLIGYGTMLVGNWVVGFGIGQVGALELFYSGISPSIATTIICCTALTPYVIEFHALGQLGKNREFGYMLGKSHLGCHREYI